MVKTVARPKEIAPGQSSTCEAIRQEGVAHRTVRRDETEAESGEGRSARLERVRRRFAESFAAFAKNANDLCVGRRQLNGSLRCQKMNYQVGRLMFGKHLDGMVRHRVRVMMIAVEGFAIVLRHAFRHCALEISEVGFG